jgi:zinc protease
MRNPSFLSVLILFFVSTLFSCKTANETAVSQTAVKPPVPVAATSPVPNISAGTAVPDSPPNSEKVSSTQQLSSEPIPFDPETRTGVLSNGLRYFVRYNAKPEAYAEMRLAVNAGSLLESEDQQGLAHFAEHMAFNGTQNFPKNELVDYLESIGTKFGAHLNAYTSFDETVYMLRVPTEDPEIFSKGIQILEDWSSRVLFEGEEIDKERGVVIEEWRTRLGPNERMRQRYFPKLFHDSRYAERLPIGKKDILESFKYETLRKFYRDWYRPDLMAVVIVGDIDVDAVEKEVIERFSAIPAADNPPKRVSYPVPDHKETFIAIESDEEASYNTIMVQYKHPAKTYSNLNDYRESILHRLYNGMMSARLDELGQSGNPPFLFAYTYYGGMVRTKDAYTAYAYVNDNGFEEGLSALLRENARVRAHGFTETEFERMKKEILTGLEQKFRERDKTESRNLASQFVGYFLDASPVPGIENQLELNRQLLPTISLKEVNALAKKWVTDENRVIVLTGAKKEGAKLPAESELREILQRVDKEPVAVYVDEVSSAPLLGEMPVSGKIMQESKVESLGLTELLLDNGVRVILKPTDFKNDEVRLEAFRPGGTSNYGEESYMSASMSDGIVEASGLGEFSNVQLKKYLSDKVVNLYPYIGELKEGFRGTCSTGDLETIFQMIYLYCTTVREDQDAFMSFLSKQKGWYNNLLSNPDNYFYHQVQKIMSGNHPRRGYPDPDQLEKVDKNEAYRIFGERFGDANGFTFVFVGNFDLVRIRDFAETYLASLPSTGKEHSWTDLGIKEPDGVVEEVLRKGKEEKSRVSMEFSGALDWDPAEIYRLQSMVSVLRIMLRESMREEKGGVYGVSAYARITQFPEPKYRITISWTCSPDNVESLTETAMRDIKKLRKDGTDSKNLIKVQETQRKELEVGFKENRYWLNELSGAYENGEDPVGILEKEKRIETLTSSVVKDAAVRYFDMGNYVLIKMFPEK